MDLADRIRQRLGAHYPNNPLFMEHADAAAAISAALDLAEDLRGDDAIHACEGRGEPDCACCCAQSIEFVIGRALGVSEEVSR